MSTFWFWFHMALLAVAVGYVIRVGWEKFKDMVRPGL